MTISIKNIFKELNGLKLTQTSRSANMECLKFGFKKNKNNKNIGEFRLHIQSEWRIIKKENILIGSNDLFEPNSNNKNKAEFDYENGNLRDEKLKNLIESNNLTILKISTDNFGGLIINFNNNIELQTINLNSINSEYNEFWRIIDNRKIKTQHIVARISGIEIE